MKDFVARSAHKYRRTRISVIIAGVLADSELANIFQKSFLMICCGEDTRPRAVLHDLLISDDCTPLLPLLYDLGLTEDSYKLAVADVLSGHWHPSEQRQAESRLWALCSLIDKALKIIKIRSNILVLRQEHPNWNAIIDDLFQSVQVLRFYRGGRSLTAVEPNLSYLLNVRLNKLQCRLFCLWDDNGYLSELSIDWALDVIKFLNCYDQPFLLDKLEREDFENLAYEFYTVTGRDKFLRLDPICTICQDDSSGKMATRCHGRLCGRLYHEACIRTWIRSRIEKAIVPKCPVCSGIWVTRRGKSQVDLYDVQAI